MITDYELPIIKLHLSIKEASNRLYVVRTPLDLDDYLRPLRYQSEESFIALHLNSRHEVIGLHEVSKGTLSSSLVHPREVFKAAILNNSYAILVAHNHPSGSELVPSNEDMDATKTLLDAAKILGINLVDHVIVSPVKSAYSIRENHPDLWSKR